MKSAGNNHPWKRFFIRRDEISIAKEPTFSELPSDEILNPTTFRINPEKAKINQKNPFRPESGRSLQSQPSSDQALTGSCEGTPAPPLQSA